MASCYAPDRAQSELRQFTAFSWRHSGQKYTTHTQEQRRENRNRLVHSLIGDAVFRKTRWYKKASGEHNRATGLATRLATMPGKRRN